MEIDLGELQEALGHRFARPELLIRALTHRSFANEQTVERKAAEPSEDEDNERLEFLGDAVLGLVVAEAMFLVHPGWREGELTRVRAQFVSRQHMAQVAEEIGLGRHLRLSRGEDRSGLRRKSTVLSNTMEAVLGALFLDAGLEPVRQFVQRHVVGKAELESLTAEALGNYKSALQELLQAERAGTPVYRVKSESGPDHRKRFLVEVRLKTADGVPGNALARGLGSTKKHAEQDAARRALNRLRSANRLPGSSQPEDVVDPEQEEQAAQ